MSRNDDLHQLLNNQRIAQDSDEMKELRGHREDIEAMIREAFAGADITIRYGGSKAKGTMILESYDLDIVVYAHHSEDSLGETLGEIYDNIADVLSTSYHIEKKNSALRLSVKENQTEVNDIHIDVVPGRFVDDALGDAYLHQNEPGKARLKTNLETHIDHIKNSGVTDGLKLLKLMRVRHDVPVKQFALDLLGVNLLSGKDKLSLDDQLTHALETIRDSETPIAIQDPANPQGNDLSDLLADHIWADLRLTASAMLDQADEKGWATAYGDADSFDVGTAAVITQAAEAVDEPTKPWAS